MSTDVIESLSARIRAEWEVVRSPLVPETIITAASLAHHGFLPSVERMYLGNVDLSSVPAEHLASLAACATGFVWIRNVSNTNLTSILDSCKSDALYIRNQSLNTEETRALVRAMANVERVELGLNGEVTLDISTLVTYGGRGKCKEVTFYNNTAKKYREEVRGWAQRISWRVTRDDSNVIFIKRE